MNTIIHARRQFVALLSTLVLLASSLGAGGAVAADCQTPVGRDFPAVPLQKSKLSAPALLKLNQEIDKEGFDVLSLLIVQDCQLVFERYKAGVDRDDTHFLYGATTVLPGALVGRLMKEGKIKSLDAPLATLIKRPAFVADENWDKLQQIRLSDAMRQRSGLEWKMDQKLGYYPVHHSSADMLRDGIKLPLMEKPGARHKGPYSDYDAALVGFAVSDVLGQDFPAAAQTLLLGPLQIQADEWAFKDRMGRYSAGYGARMRPMDLLKIGQMYLQGGRWNSAQLLDEEFVKAAMPMTGPYEPGLGLMWGNGKHADLGDMRFFFIGGRKTQRLYVFPDWGMVVALTATLQPADDPKLVLPLIANLKAALVKDESEDAYPKLEALVLSGFQGTRTAAEPWDKPRKSAK